MNYLFILLFLFKSGFSNASNKEANKNFLNKFNSITAFQHFSENLSCLNFFDTEESILNKIRDKINKKKHRKESCACLLQEIMNGKKPDTDKKFFDFDQKLKECFFQVKFTHREKEKIREILQPYQAIKNLEPQTISTNHEHEFEITEESILNKIRDKINKKKYRKESCACLLQEIMNGKEPDIDKKYFDFDQKLKECFSQVKFTHREKEKIKEILQPYQAIKNLEPQTISTNHEHEFEIIENKTIQYIPNQTTQELINYLIEKIQNIYHGTAQQKDDNKLVIKHRLLPTQVILIIEDSADRTKKNIKIDKSTNLVTRITLEIIIANYQSAKFNLLTKAPTLPSDTQRN